MSKIKKVPVLGNNTALYLPFVRTPINLLEYSLDNSIFAPLLPKFRKAIKEGGAASDEAVGRMMAGSAVMGLAGTVAYGGKLTGSGDSNYRKRVVANAALGWQEKSWRDKEGNYHSYNRFDPGATPVGFAVDLVDMVMRLNYMSKERPDLRLEKYVESAAKMMGYSMWSNMADKAMLAGVATLAEDLISAKRGLTIIGDPPEGAGRGWLLAQKRNNPKAVTIIDLIEIIKDENFQERIKHIKNKKRKSIR